MITRLCGCTEDNDMIFSAVASLLYDTVYVQACKIAKNVSDNGSIITSRRGLQLPARHPILKAYARSMKHVVGVM